MSRLYLPPQLRFRKIACMGGLLIFVVLVLVADAIMVAPATELFRDVLAANVRFCFDLSRKPPLVVHLSPMT
jgi:hypothetical protein